MLHTKNKNSLIGHYPSCDMLNNALLALINGDNETAFSEIVQAISKADGYIHSDIKEEVKKRMD